MTVAELRRRLNGMPGHLEVVLEISDQDDILVQSELALATVEERCDEIERLYLWGEEPEDGYETDGGKPPPRPKLEVVR